MARTFLAVVAVLFCTAFASAADLVTLVRVPDSGIQPQVAVDADGAIHLIYFKGEPLAGDAFYVKSSDDGATWSKPLRVNSTPSSVVATGNMRGAQVALGKGGRVHVAWMGSKATAPGGDHKKAPMLYARLRDKGDGFEAQKNVITEAYGLDGGGSVAADGKGGVYVAWHAGTDRGEQGRRVFVARSGDEGKTFSREQPADDASGACGCCGMRIAADARGVYVLYRNASTKADRDMSLLVSTNAGQSFKGGVFDQWKVEMCPGSLPGLYVGPTATLAAWETAEGRVEFAKVDAKTGKAGKPVAAPKLKDAPPGPQKYPALAVDKHGRTIFAWAEGMGWDRGGAVAWQAYDATGRAMAVESGVKFGVPKWSLIAAFPKKDGGFVVMY